jgi:tetratricopeptide (TPR) repeat protein
MQPRLEAMLRRRYSPAMRSLALLSLLLAATVLRAETATNAAALPWQHTGIASITGTSAVPVTVRILTPQEAALEQLAAPATNPPTATTNAFGSIQRIYGIAASTSIVMDAAAMLEAGRAQKVMDLADDLFRRGQLEQAFAAITNELGRVKHRAPRSILLSKLGAYHFRMQRYAAAAAVFDEARRNSPLDPGTLCNYAACRLMMNETEVAEGLFKSMNLNAIRDRKLLFSIYFNLGCIKSLQTNMNESLDYLKRAAAADPVATLAALGDTQLDNVRLDVGFLALQQNLEQFIKL